jgi:hypothetical protein
VPTWAFGEVAKGASLVPCSCNKCFNRKRKQRIPWENIFGRMDLRQTILGGSSMVKHIVREGVVRQRFRDYDADARVVNMLNEY